MWTPTETDFEAWGLLRREPWADCGWYTESAIYTEPEGWREHTEADAREYVSGERAERAEAVGRAVARLQRRDMAIAVAYYGAFPGASGRPYYDCRRMRVSPRLTAQEVRDEIGRVRRLVCAAVELSSDRAA
jgi:hypothetical protein